MNFASGQLLKQARLADINPVPLFTAELAVEVTQIIIANTEINTHSIPISIYHSKDTPPVADGSSILYDSIYVRKSLVLTAPAVGSGIMLVKGDTLLIKGDDGITVSLYGITANIAPGLSMAEINDWNRDAARNNASPPDGAPEGMSPGDVNNVMREMMAVVARWHQVIGGLVVSAGTGQAYTVALDNRDFAWAKGRHLSWYTHTANADNPTLQVNGLAAVSIRDWFGNALQANALPSGVLIDCVYDGQYVRVHEVYDTHNRIEQLLTLGQLVDAPVIEWDLAAAPQAHVTLTANRRMGLPTNGVEGQVYVLYAHQDAAGNRTLQFRNTEYDGGRAGHPLLSTDPNVFDIISYTWYRGKMRFAGILKGYRI